MRKSLFILIFCLVLILAFSTPHVYSADKSTSGQGKNEPADISKGWTPWVSLDSYKIGSSDVLEIVTWKEPDFTRAEVLVRIDGKISFPLLGDIQASGRTPLQVKNVIETGLKEYIDNPIVTVTVKVPGSQKFYILGEVENTGEYVLKKDLTVLQAFALAGGFTKWASKKEIILLRHEDGKEKIIRVNYKEIVKGKDFSQNIHIKVNDTIIVP
ncbi:MAG: polysaccharide biosynthesis/export family protein [Deltaproteobacteria bacterium]|nr:polysaccharide biosynthesis/export family protein [Deltaproteobacteria bacterium]